jgi:PAS domain S-box-containing protein
MSTKPAVGRIGRAPSASPPGRAQPLELALRLANILMQSRDVEQAASSFIETALQLTTVDCALIYLVKPDGACDLVAHGGVRCAETLPRIRRHETGSPLSKRLLAGEPYSFEHGCFAELDSAEVRRSGLRAQLTVPIKAPDGEVVAGFIVGSHDDEAIAETDRTTISLLALHAGAAFTRITAVLQRQSAEMRYRDLVESVADTVFTADADGRLTFVSPQVENLLGVKPEDLVGRQGAAFISAIDARRFTQLVDSAGAGAICSTVKTRHTDGSLRFTRVLAVPRFIDGEFAGVTGTSADVTDTVRAERRAQRTMRRLEKTMEAAVRALARVVEMRDPYTAGHQERVTQLALAIGSEMGLSPRRLTSLRIAAAIHDLGKIAIPGEILTKPGPLEEGEWLLLRRHPETAHDILCEIQFPGPVARIIREHHERQDGSGYPRGLDGPGIRPEARILAVADVVEAMSAHRPYRPALGLDAAIEEITTGRRRLYDGKVVDTCLRIIRHGFSFDGAVDAEVSAPA